MADFDSKSEEQMSSAAEVARKRREQRRKKILASPEDRLKKLMGLNGSVTGSASSLNSETDSQAPTSYFSDIYEEHSPSMQRVNRSVADDDGRVTRRTVNWEFGESQTTHRGFSTESRQEWSQTQSSRTTTVTHSGQQPNTSPTVQWGQLAQDFLSADGLDENLFSPSPQHSEHQQQLQLMSQQLNKWRYVLAMVLGLLIRLSFMLSLGEEYVQSILYPFVAFEICLVGYQKAVGLDLASSVGGLWLMLLQLCGLKQDVINAYKKFMGLFTTAVEDLAAYLFAFVMLHALTELF